MLEKIYNWVVGDHNEKFVKTLRPIVDKINVKEEEYQALSESEFLKNTDAFKARLESGETLDDLLVEAFATVKNACRRLTDKGHEFTIGNKQMKWEMIPYDVQLLGGIVIHQGKISEMKTGEGKTLVSVAPMYLNALAGKGAHLVTANEYLAERDALWMAQVYEFLGMKVGVVKHGQSPAEKRAAYAADITYGTNNEFGFDYLRDNMAVHVENQVMRSQNFCIVDEVDSILIDEARTPLIISTPDDEATDKYSDYMRLVGNLQKGEHYQIDEKEKTVTLTEEGIEKMEQLLGIENIYTERGFQEVHHIESALKAQGLFERDTDYVIQDGQVVIVDEFTGRLMPGRRFSGGLHQAIEAKEGVEIKRESKTLASITFQNYFRMYAKLAGMTGTAMTEAKEFAEIYGLDTVVIPTNKPVARIDKSDAVFKSLNGKYMAMMKRIREAHESGQPVLIGTISIEKSELLSKLLKKEGIPHTVLNAKHHEKEAEIIEKAGQPGVVTIATNMAGRGTDIKPSKEAYEAGGLLVIGTERHESRRIDNQLRGRSGRQGDPGETQFFVCMDDDLMRLFGGQRMKNMMEAMNFPEDMPIENSVISNAIESAQKKVEVRNFEIRKHVLQYDDVMNVHRERIYEQRNAALKKDDIKEELLDVLKKYVPQIVLSNVAGQKPEFWNYDEILNSVKQFGPLPFPTAQELEDKAGENEEQLQEILLNVFLEFYEKKEAELEKPEILRQAEKAIYLRNIDRLWMQHIDEMTRLREAVSLQAYANKNPLHEYKREAFEAFKNMVFQISVNTIRELMNVQIHESPVDFVRTAPKVEDLKTNESEIEEQLLTSAIAAPVKAAPAAPATNVQAQPQTIKRKDGVTVYKVEDTPSDESKVGRNDPCPCGSGKKYKKCHGA